MEGTFLIIDRASPKLRGIRIEAERTDAALVHLGVTMDAVGSQKRTKQLDNQARSVRALGRETETANTRASRSFRNLDRDVRNHSVGLGRLRIGLRQVGGEIFKLAKPLGLVFGLGTALGVAGQAIGALAGGVVGLLPRLGQLSGALAPAATGMAGLGIAMVTTKLAFGGIGAAVSGTAGALNKLTPAAARLAIQLRNMRPLLREFRASAGGGPGGLLASVGGALQQARNPAVRSTINQTLSQTSNTLGGLVRNATSSLTSPQALADFSNIAGQGNVVVRRLGDGAIYLGSALRHVLVAAKPLTMWLSSVTLGWAKNADVMAKNGRESGRLAAFFDKTRVSLTGFGHILRNLWVTFRNLSRDAGPLGESLYKAAERTTAGWARLTSTVDSRTGLTMQFTKMAPAIKAIFNLVGALGAAIFRLGSTGGLSSTVNNLTKLVPALERIFGGLASAFGPQLAQTLTDLGNLVSSLSGVTGPFSLLLSLTDNIFKVLNAIVNISAPVKGVFAEIFSVALIARFLSKLGLISIGWQRVAASATEAAVAQGAAMGAGGGGFGIGIGPSLRGGGGIIGRIRGAWRGRPGMIGPATEGEALASQFGAVEGGTFGAGAVAGGVRGLSMGAGRLGMAGLGIASKFALPLLGISAAFGGLSAGRSGNFGHQTMQTLWGAENGLTGGLLGSGLGALGLNTHQYDTPEQRAQRAAGGIQKDIGTTLAADARQFTGTDRLTHQIQDLQRIANSVNDRQTKASQDLLASIQDEISARKTLRAQLDAEATQAGTARGSSLIAGAGAVAAKAGGGAAGIAAGTAYLKRQIARYGGTGPKNVAARGVAEGGLLHANPNDPAIANYIIATEAAQGRTVAIGAAGAAGAQGALFAAGSTQAAGIFSGTNAERATLKSSLSLGAGAGTDAQIAAQRSDLVANLVAHGLTKAQAIADVAAWIKRGFRGDVMTKAQQAQIARTGLSSRHGAGHARHASGGRIAGSGMQDTVPLGGLAAPGELIVNRHTERRANAALAHSGMTLGGMVEGEGKRHSEGFATGGRVKQESGVDTSRVNGALMGDMRLLARSGNTVDITSGFRTRAHQARLYAAYKAGGNIAAPPGLSAHEYGMAVDAYINGQPAGNFGNAKLANYGLVAPVSGDPVHLELLRDSPQLLGLAVALKRAGKQIANVGVGGGTTTGGAVTGAAKNAATPTPFGTNIRSLTALAQVNAATNNLMGAGSGGLVGVVGSGAASVGGSRSLASATGGGSPSGPGAAAFAAALARATGLDPRVTAAWVRRENDGGGPNNWLNVSAGPGGQGYSGVPEQGSGRFASFQTPGDALTESAYWINSMSNYAGIKASAGKGIQAQLAAIEASPWDAEHYPGGLKLARGGRAPRWGGWKAGGVNGVYSTPTVIGVGDKGAEHVKVTPAGKSSTGPAQINATFNIYGGNPGEVQREVEAALNTFAKHLDHDPIDGQDI